MALNAVRYNPAVRPLYARVVAKHPDQKAIAIGHAHAQTLAPDLRHLEDEEAVR
jgi:hypothetical protein